VQQEAPANRCRKPARGLGWQDAEEGTAGRNPGEGALEDADGDASIEQVGGDEGGQGTVGVQVSAEQGTAETDAGCGQQVLDEGRRQVQHSDRVANERQRGADAAEGLLIARDREVAGLPARGGAQLRQVHGQPLLELTGTG
jgi:hypothetical protein